MGFIIPKRKIRIEMLKSYAQNLSKYWDDVISNNGEFSLNINILPLIRENIGGIEVEFLNREYKRRTYQIENNFSFIYDKYNIKKITDEHIYFGDRSFLIAKPMFYSYWSKKQSQSDNRKLIHQIFTDSLREDSDNKCTKIR